jgi:hypothetical protein
MFPTLPELGRVLGAMTVSELLIPHDCCDGFLGAGRLLASPGGLFERWSSIRNIDIFEIF